jgi:transposase
MDILHTHVAGVDVHKDVLAITVIIGESDAKPQVTQFTCKTFTEDLEEAGEKLIAMGVEDVAMESTGVYWKPVYNVWSKQGIRVTLGNATHLRNVPGRKTDMADSHWIAQLHRNGLIKASFIPNRHFQGARALTRQRRNLVQDRTRVKNRILKVLEDGNVKLSSVASDVFGVGGMAVLRKIAEDEKKPLKLAMAVETSLNKKREDLRKALTNTLTKQHCFLIRQLLRQLDELNASIEEIDQEIDRNMTRHYDVIERMVEIPGIKVEPAEAILAEASTDMSAFANERMFAAWAGVAPGNNESAGKKKERELGMVIPISGGC